MIVARLIRIEFPQILWQIEAQNLAEIAWRVAGRDQMIGEKSRNACSPFSSFGRRRCSKWICARLLSPCPQSSEACRNLMSRGGIDRRRESNREQRQNAILAGKIEPARIAAAAPHRGDTGPGAKHEASPGEDQGPA